MAYLRFHKEGEFCRLATIVLHKDGQLMFYFSYIRGQNRGRETTLKAVNESVIQVDSAMSSCCRSTTVQIVDVKMRRRKAEF